jgi:hypothetical protein
VRDRDRFWWLVVLAGVACGIASVIVPYHLVTTALTPAENQFVTDAEYRQDIAMDVALGLAFLGLGVTLVVMAIRARRHHLVRLVAFQSDADAMPLANIRTDATRVPDVTTQPLELMWRISRANSFFYTLILFLKGLGLLLTAGLSIFGLVLLLIHHKHPQSVWEITLYVASIVVPVAILVGLAFMFVRFAPFVFGRPFGVTATDQGVDARTEFGTRVHIDWDEARLLEVVGGDANAWRRYSLYAPGKRISWAEYMERFGADYVPAHISSSEMTLREAALLNLVVARTGLPMRTFAKSLQRRPASSDVLKRSTSVIMYLVFALILAGITAADLLIPVPPLLWLQWGSIGALAIVVLSIVIAAIWTAFARRVSSTHATPQSAGAPSLRAPGVAYILSWRPPLRRRLALVALGVCFVPNLIPAVLMMMLALDIALPGYHPQFSYEGDFTVLGRFGLAIVHGILGIVGGALIYGASITATARIRANKDGLTIITGKRERVMAWSSVQDIWWGVGSGGQFSYLVKTDVPTVQASWPAGPQTASGDPTSQGAVPIGADELAALVAAQIDKPIRVRDGEGTRLKAE